MILLYILKAIERNKLKKARGRLESKSRSEIRKARENREEISRFTCFLIPWLEVKTD